MGIKEQHVVIVLRFLAIDQVKIMALYDPKIDIAVKGKSSNNEYLEND